MQHTAGTNISHSHSTQSQRSHSHHRSTPINTERIEQRWCRPHDMATALRHYSGGIGASARSRSKVGKIDDVIVAPPVQEGAELPRDEG